MDTQASPLKYVEVDGTRLAYRESGQGEPMVLVHGHISDYRTWTKLEALLSTKYHVYSYSRRFAYPNEPIKDDEGQPWEQDAVDLGRLIETLGLGPVHAVGNSSGSTTILLLVKTKPHLFRTLLLEEPPLITLFYPSLPPPLPSVLGFLLRHPIAFFPVTIYGATTIAPAIEHAKQGRYDEALLTFGSGCLGPRFWPSSQQDPERRKMNEDNKRVLGNFFRYNQLPDYTATDAANVALPTLVLTGAAGPYFQQCLDAEFLRLCGAQRKEEVKVPDAGHLMHEDNPQAVFEAIVKFVGGA